MATACQGHLEWLHEGEGYRQRDSHVADTIQKRKFSKQACILV